MLKILFHFLDKEIHKIVKIGYNIQEFKGCDHMKLLSYLKRYRIMAIIGFLFKMFEAMLELLVPIVMADMIDHGVVQGSRTYVIQKGMFLVLLGIIGYGSALVCQYYASKTSQSVGTALRNDMYHKINQFDSETIDEFGAPSLITRITNDIIQIQLAIAMTIRLTSRVPIILFGSLLMTFLIHGGLSLIFLIGAILLAGIIMSIMKISVPYFIKIQKKLDQISLLVRENLNGIRVIRAFSKQKSQIKRFKENTKDQKEVQIKVGKIQALLNPLTYFIVNITIIIIIYRGGFFVQSGSLSQGDMIALVSYMNQILLALLVYANVLSIYNKAIASYQRIFEVLETAPKLQQQDSDITMEGKKEAILFDHVSFGYGKKQVLTDITFDVKKGETIGIIGGTGSGKSTLVKLIGRFYDVDKGKIYIDEKPIDQFSLSRLKKEIGYVFQSPVLFSGTVRENMQLSNQYLSDEQINEALKIAQAKEFVDHLPDGLDTRIEQGGKNLSGGQKQRLTIARAIVNQPKILILDDSASALDFATDAKLRKALKQIKDTTTLIISQRTSSLQHANRILVLSHGSVVGFDNHQNLLKTCDIYREIHESQQVKEAK